MGPMIVMHDLLGDSPLCPQDSVHSVLYPPLKIRVLYSSFKLIKKSPPPLKLTMLDLPLASSAMQQALRHARLKSNSAGRLSTGLALLFQQQQAGRGGRGLLFEVVLLCSRDLSSARGLGRFALGGFTPSYQPKIFESFDSNF